MNIDTSLHFVLLLNIDDIINAYLPILNDNIFKGNPGFTIVIIFFKITVKEFDIYILALYLPKLGIPFMTNFAEFEKTGLYAIWKVQIKIWIKFIWIVKLACNYSEDKFSLIPNFLNFLYFILLRLFFTNIPISS